MFKKLQLPFALLIVFSLVLGACAAPVEAPATEVVQPEATEAVVVTETAEPVVTEEATPEPVALDYVALFGQVISEMKPDAGYGTVKVAALSEELADKAPFLLDVREAAELEKDGYLEGAVNIPVRDLMKNLDKLPAADQPIVIYCASGHRGALAFAALKMLGYTDVRNLAGGLGAWKKANLPVATGSTPDAPKVLSTPVIADEALFTALDEFFTTLPENFYTVKSDGLMEVLTSSTPPTILDVRTVEEYGKDGFIEGAVNVPLSDILTSLDQLPAQDQPIVVHCVSGHRAAVVVMALRMLGYTDVINLAGGLNAWKAGQFPVVGWVDWSATWGEFLKTLPADQGYYTVKGPDLNQKIAEGATPFMVDLREASELEKDGYIEGAVNLPVRDLLKNLDKLPALDQPIVVYCASGHRGGFATAALRLLGYTDVTNLAGGFKGWVKAEFPVVTGVPAEAVAGEAPAVDATRLANMDAWLTALPEGFMTVLAPDLATELAGEAPLVVDIRTVEEFAEGHIDGALNIPVNELYENLTQLPDKGANIVITCKSGHRGAIALMAMSMMGYTNVRNLAGGMNAWAAAELPTVK